MLVMALFNVLLGGVIGQRCRVMLLAPLTVIAGVEGLLCTVPPRTWTAVAWPAGVLLLFLEVGYLAGSAYAVYCRAPSSSRLEMSTATEMSGQ